MSYRTTQFIEICVKCGKKLRAISTDPEDKPDPNYHCPDCYRKREGIPRI
jgi:DNA-directed RNA polymerase subunit RPC12/RpoP